MVVEELRVEELRGSPERAASSAQGANPVNSCIQ
jgi:hypothetical protein